MMLPFLLGIVYQIIAICKKIFQPQYLNFSVWMILFDATLLAQMTLVSPDVLLIFFLLTTYNSILSSNKKLTLLGLSLLSIISIRGMVCAIVIIIGLWIQHRKKNKNYFHPIKVLYFYSIPFIIPLTYFLFHYYQVGWSGLHDKSNWAGSFQLVGLKGIIYNTAIIIWRIIDFGRIGIYLIVLMLIIPNFNWKRYRSLKGLSFLILLFLGLYLTTVWASGLTGHRYFLPIYVLSALVSAQILFESALVQSTKKALAMLWILFLLTGNLWVYPDKISTGWDSTLSHLPYYTLRKEAVDFLNEQHISISSVASFFPNDDSFEIQDLNSSNQSFKSFDGRNPFVFYSNIYNLKDHELQILNLNYQVIKYFKKGNVIIKILQHNDVH